MKYKQSITKALNFIPLPAIVISAIGYICLRFSTSANFDTFLAHSGGLVTSQVNIWWQSLTALFWSFSGLHWLGNVIYLFVISWLCNYLHIKWRYQFMVFLIGGYLANLLFAIALSCLHVHALIVGASPGIASMLGSLVALFVLQILIPKFSFTTHYFWPVVYLAIIMFSMFHVQLDQSLYSSHLHFTGYFIGACLTIVGMLLKHPEFFQKKKGD